MGAKCRAAREEKKKYELTDLNLEEAEQRVLSHSGVPADQIRQENVKVGEFKGEDVYMHTVICGNNQPDKPVLVLCHGYGGSGALFYKIIKPLTERFNLIFFDLVGMGGSSRPNNFDADGKMTPEQAVDYFVEYIEAWRVAMKLEQFYLSAHSFGGFVCGHYAIKYHMHIKKLLMLSPIGVRHDPAFEALSEEEKNKSW